MLIIGYKSRALPLSLIAAIVACVAERNPFLRNDSQGNGNEEITRSSGRNDSDADDEDEEGDDDEAGHPFLSDGSHVSS
jgi:hypothetical protein